MNYKFLQKLSDGLLCIEYRGLPLRNVSAEWCDV